MSFAQYTKVPVERTRGEIEQLLTKYKADQFASAIDNASHRAMIRFRLNKTVIRFEMDLPTEPQALRTRWRALHLTIKAKLESVVTGIETFEEAFLAHIEMPNGRRFGELAIPQIEQAIERGEMPKTALIEFHA